ncbi:MAG: LON peptidase substrate-binding domain-containing protein, partial [Acidobacteria bacterium]|nr:LON peptidase substrate-binding domain-containing protein [Acidobacteriota bacterium]
MRPTEQLEKDLQIPDLLPVIPLRDITVFPYIITPLSIGRDRSLAAVDAALGSNRMVVLAGQVDQSEDEPDKENLFPVGTVATIMRMLKLPDGRMRILVQGVARCQLEYFTVDKNYREAKVSTMTEIESDQPALEVEALIRNVKGLLERIASLGKPISSEVLVIANSMEHPGRLADLVASNIELKTADAQAVLQELHVLQRLRMVYDFLAREVSLLEMQQQINTQARGEMDRSQRDFYLRQQLKIIQAELGEGNELQEEINAYREKMEALVLPDEAKKEIEKQLRRLEHMHPDTAETGLIRSYLDWMTELPWGKFSNEDINLTKAKKVLDDDHFGLEEIKERILEFLSVRKLNPSMKNPILCFVGPPGVGKTSLGRSIARALDRKFVRLSLGGLRDEAEIRGHRKTYVGALPGRIIQGVSQAGTMNPVFVMDEVDKIGQDFRGDPSAALLEVLDPEQNNAFR